MAGNTGYHHHHPSALTGLNVRRTTSGPYCAAARKLRFFEILHASSISYTVMGNVNEIYWAALLDQIL